jgi:hypothetical protein
VAQHLHQIARMALRLEVHLHLRGKSQGGRQGG